MSSGSTGGTEGSSPASSPASAASLTMAAPKYGTLVPNRIFVGGISASTSEAELAQLFSAYGNVKATKIISDRAGVSKGYGFVTFETEEEAKRLQQESECIVLRERKLNIAPAIKKQPFNRSFDGGSGSPPSVPTSTYYYTNGMGLAYQNGMTFYNTAAPAPGTPLAPPTDPATIYQAAGVFGPQAATGHQTFAPVMYPCPAPSLYMPQQYQYSPMPYESYYASAAATGAQYLYPTSNSQSNTSGSGSNSGSGNNGTGATSPATGPPPPLPSLPPPPPAHFYAPAAPPPHHHPPVPAGPPPPQVDHLYYSFAAGPPPPHAPMGLTDQQLLLYTTENPCQQTSTSDSQAAPQEDSRSTSSHSEQPHGETQTASGSATPLVSLMPVKFPISGRYTNYHPIALHTSNMHNSQGCLNETAEDCTGNQMHCRTIVYHPAAVYIPHAHTPPFHNTTGGASLLPTPPTQQPFDANSKNQHPNARDYTKSSSTNAPGNYAKTQNHNVALIHHNTFKPQSFGNPRSHKYSTEGSHKYPNIAMSPRLPVQYKRNAASNMGSPACYQAQRSNSYSSSIQRSSYSSHTNTNNQNYGSKPGNTGQNYEYDRRNANYSHDQYLDNTLTPNKSMNHASNRRNAPNNYRNVNSNANSVEASNNNNNNQNENYKEVSNSQVDSSVSAKEVQSTVESSTSSDKPTSPPPAPYSPMTRPLPTSSPTPQVQFYAQPQNRYQHTLTPSQHQSQQQQQQQSSSQRRFTSVGPPLATSRKPSEKYTGAPSQTTVLRQSKYKVNGIMQTGSKVADDSLGGAGDAPPNVGRMPITPPGTPRAPEQSPLSEACHQMQALSL